MDETKLKRIVENSGVIFHTLYLPLFLLEEFSVIKEKIA
ncbi:hypothetical protein UF75_2660 [Desulfosporosinus sp. I2]|nr:hypothetical protein UF75_2660 [Desulfosporosinus sp. I2]